MRKNTVRLLQKVSRTAGIPIKHLKTRWNEIPVLDRSQIRHELEQGVRFPNAPVGEEASKFITRVVEDAKAERRRRR